MLQARPSPVSHPRGIGLPPPPIEAAISVGLPSHTLALLPARHPRTIPINTAPAQAMISLRAHPRRVQPRERAAGSAIGLRTVIEYGDAYAAACELDAGGSADDDGRRKDGVSHWNVFLSIEHAVGASHQITCARNCRKRSLAGASNICDGAPTSIIRPSSM